MAAERGTAIPPALILGWLGVTPFAGLAVAIAAGGPPAGVAGLPTLVFYGAVILSFMGVPNGGWRCVPGAIPQACPDV